MPAPQAPEYETPQFDTTRAALAIGRISRSYGGTVVAISPDGLALTAYDAVSGCIARLRRDRTTERFSMLTGVTMANTALCSVTN
jgi:hypothetical protein